MKRAILNDSVETDGGVLCDSLFDNGSYASDCNGKSAVGFIEGIPCLASFILGNNAIDIHIHGNPDIKLLKGIIADRLTNDKVVATCSYSISIITVRLFYRKK